jgi:hypothetical protein
MTEAAKTSFTADDLHDWLQCDRQAGRRVWLDSGLYQHMVYFIHGRAIRRFDYFYLECIIPHDPQEGIGAALNELASYVVLEYQDWLKKHKTPADFAATGLGGFLSYTKKTLEHRFCDRLREQGRVSYHEELTTGRQQTEAEAGEHVCFVSLADTASLSPEEQFLVNDWQRTCGDLAQALLAEFRAAPALAKTPALQQRLDLLLQLPESAPLDAICFLTDNWRHQEYRDFGQARLGAGFNQNNWNSYNRRLKDKWANFLACHPQPEQVDQLREYQRCFMLTQER